jgi:type II secretory pathway predicted ATPase ExeA
MHIDIYGFREHPFLMTPDARLFFNSSVHSRAHAHLMYGLAQGEGFVVVTGEVGAGKTTLLHQLLRTVEPDLRVGLVSNAHGDRGELLHWVLLALGLPVEPADGYVRLFSQLQNFLIEEYARGRRVVLIFDEAQNLGVETLEELRMLSNINADKDELLQIVLVGQPQLRDLLARPELVQFAQRIASDFHLTAMEPRDVRAYIQHRLDVAGASWRIFPERTCDLVHAATRGVPRLVNILCDLCLVYGFSADSKVIDEALLREFLTGARRRGIYEQFSPLDDPPKLVRRAQ